MRVHPMSILYEQRLGNTVRGEEQQNNLTEIKTQHAEENERYIYT